jgi:hypothetical protein
MELRKSSKRAYETGRRQRTSSDNLRTAVTVKDEALVSNSAPDVLTSATELLKVSAPTRNQDLKSPEDNLDKDATSVDVPPETESKSNKRKRRVKAKVELDATSDGEETAEPTPIKRRKITVSVSESTCSTTEASEPPSAQSPIPTYRGVESSVDSMDDELRGYDLQHVPYYPHPQYLPMQVMEAIVHTMRCEKMLMSLYDTDEEHYVPMEVVLPSEARHLGLPWDVCDKFSSRPSMGYEDNTDEEMHWREESLDWNKAWENL